MVFVDTILVLAACFAGIEFYYLHSPSQCHTEIRKQHQQFTLLWHIWKPFWLHDITYIMILWYQRNSDFMISMDSWFHDIKKIIVLWHKHLFEKNKKVIQNRNYKIYNCNLIFSVHWTIWKRITLFICTQSAINIQQKRYIVLFKSII